MKRTNIPTRETCEKIHPNRRTALERFICDYQAIMSAPEWRKQLSAVIEAEKRKVERRHESKKGGI